MAANFYVKAAAYLSNEENRENIIQIVLYAVFIILFIASIIVVFFVWLISGLGSLIVSTQVYESWSLIRNNVAGVFESFEYVADENIKKDVYSFMPDFSTNLSKASISEKYPNKLLLFDTAEYEQAQVYINQIAEDLRFAKTEEAYNSLLSEYGIKTDISFSVTQNDNNFQNDKTTTKIADYQQDTVSLLNLLAMTKMPSYQYTTEDITTTNGKSGRCQTLTVTSSDGKKQVVQYTAIGNVELYIPEFVAMYQARVIMNSGVLDNSENIEAAISAADEVWDAESEEQLIEAIEEHGFDNKLLDAMETASMSAILNDSLSKGKVSATSEIIETEEGVTLSITLEAPDSEEWSSVFGLDENSLVLAAEAQTCIEELLDTNGISEQDRWISLDNFFQNALFIYFEGFFNLPVEGNELRSGTNGLLSAFGDWQDLHRMGYNYTSCWEQGITLDIEKAETPICIDLLPGAGIDCIESAFVYDVWIAENHPNEQNNYLYNSDAITIAYVINTETFKKTYGFDFPTKNLSSDIVTMFVEYSCLTGLKSFGFDEELDTIFTNDVLTDIKNGQFEIGYCHNGKHQSSDNNNNSYSSYIHYYNRNTEKPHITVKISFYDGGVYQQDTAEGVYNGISPGNNEWLGELVNPLYWFKSFRTESK